MKRIYQNRLMCIYICFFVFQYANSQCLKSVEDDKTNKIGFVNEKGDTIVPLIYDKANMLYYKFVNGICKVAKFERGYGYGYIDSIGNEIIPCSYLYLGEEHDGLIAAVRKVNLGQMYLNRKGDVILNLDSIKGIPRDFHNGLALIRKNGRYGYIDKEGKIVIPVEYMYGTDFFNGFANVSIGAKKFSVDVNGIKYKEKLCLNRDLDHYIFNNDLSEESVLEKLIDYKLEKIYDAPSYFWYQDTCRWSDYQISTKVVNSHVSYQMKIYYWIIKIYNQDYTINENEICIFYDKNHEIVCDYDVYAKYKNGMMKIKAIKNNKDYFIRKEIEKWFLIVKKYGIDYVRSHKIEPLSKDFYEIKCLK